MSSWDMGYNSDILYTYHYFEQTNPLWIKFVLNHEGFAFPDLSHGGYACELGFGQGLSINIHALTSKTQWYGNDFNPTQVQFAQNMAANGPIPNIHLYDDAFEQFAKRDDLPQFDYIYLHGIWTWISKENQQFIVDFLDKHLKIGGVVYMSYNISPGFGMMEPIRYMSQRISDKLLAKSADNNLRVQAVQDIIIKLLKHSPAFIKNNPLAAQRTVNLIEDDPNYIASEYLNNYWDIIHFGDMAKNLDRAKLQFACSAVGISQKDIFTAKQFAFLNSFLGNNQVVYEETGDFIINNAFRSDLFIKGAHKLTPSQQLAQLRQLHCISNVAFAPKEFKYSVSILNGFYDIELPPAYSKEVFTFFADHKVHSYGEVLDYFVGKNINGTIITPEQVIDLLRQMTVCSMLKPTSDPKDIKADVVTRTKHFNHEMLQEGINNPNLYLASPVSQSGILVDATLRAMVAEYMRNPKLSKEQLVDILMAKFTSFSPEQLQLICKQQNIDITSFRNSLETETQNSVKRFFDEYLPYIKSLQIV